jgi:predicted acyltransferase
MPASQRFLALDVFRGMTICFMIIVNTPGNFDYAYPALRHAAWFGFTPTDLVFPSFLFAVGTSMSFVMPKWSKLQQSEVLKIIFRRTIIIFLLGYLMYWFPFVQTDANNHVTISPISHTMILGVLQHIALTYFVASLLIYYLKLNATIVITVSILLLYWPVMIWFGDAHDPLSMTGNLGYKIEKLLIGENHMWHGEGIAFDPEGLLTTLPALGNIVAGFVVGKFIQQKGKTFGGLSKLLLAGLILIVIGHLWDFGFPIAKKLWTSSYIVYTVGLDCLIIGILIYIIDFLNLTKWTYFFVVFGKNPLFIYLLAELGATVLYLLPNIQSSFYVTAYTRYFQPIINPYFGSLLFAVTYMLICWSIGWMLDRRKIYIRI